MSALLVLALQGVPETLWQFSVDLAIEDAQNSLRALLKREPAARIPEEEHTRALLVETNDDGQGVRFEPLNQWIVSHWPADGAASTSERKRLGDGALANASMKGTEEVREPRDGATRSRQ